MKHRESILCRIEIKKILRVHDKTVKQSHENNSFIRSKMSETRSEISRYG